MQVDSVLNKFSKLSISENSYATPFDKIEDHLPAIALKVLDGSKSTKDLTNFFAVFPHSQRVRILTGSSQLVSKILQIVGGDFAKLKIHWQMILREIGPTITSLELGVVAGLSLKQFQTLERVFPNVQELSVLNMERELTLEFPIWSRTLTRLVLDGNAATLKNRELRKLLGFTSLTHLSLKRCQGVTDICTLRELKALKVLHLDGCENITHGSLTVLKLFQNLETLSLCRVKPSALSHLREARNLQNLSLSRFQNKDEGLSIPNVSLKSLTLDHETLSLSDLNDSVKKNKKLAHINLRGAIFLDDSYLEPLESLSFLQELDLSHTKLVGGGLKYLQKNKGLSSLKLDYCKALRHFSHLPQVTKLSLKGFVAHETIDLSLYFPNLLSLNLSYQEHAAFMLPALPSEIKALVLIECKTLKGSDLEHLRKCVHLRALDLTGCANVDDSCYPQLKALTQLGYLNLRYTGLSQAAVNGLRKELKSTQIQFSPRDYSEEMMRDLWEERLS